MIPVSVIEVLNITGGRLLSGKGEGLISSVTTDSRKAQTGSLFVAICGNNVDGHKFLKDVSEKGAVCALTEKETDYEGEMNVILVPNSVKAMGKIAHLIMKKLSVPSIAITGSVGKTTTRDMTYAVVNAKYNTLKNQGNFNNEIGVPLTIFEADEKTEAAVIEMGMDNFGEIDALSAITQPDVSIITNIGMSHIERLGSQENIYKAKSEIFYNTKPNGVVILNGDDKILMSHKKEIAQRVITVGVLNKEATFIAENIVSDEKSVSFTAKGLGHKIDVNLPVPGEHNVINALLAVATGIYYLVPDEKISEALSNFTLTGMRMDIIKSGKITIIDDCYNAAPASVCAALSVLSKQEGRKVAILGDIAALGEFSFSAHKNLGAEVVKNEIDLLITIGENAKFIAEGAFENGMDSENFVSFSTTGEAISALGAIIKNNDVVLVKASRVMGLERVTDALKNL